jgi:hypothetical protein
MGMAEKVARTGVSRDDMHFLYFIKQGAVWRVPRKQPGVPKGKPELVTEGGIDMESSYIYFLDKDGDIARSKRAIGGQKRKKAKKVKKAKKAVKKAPKKAAKKAPKKAAKKAAKKAPKKAAKKAPKKAAKKAAKKAPKKAAKKPAKKAAKKPAKKTAKKK